MINLRDMHKFMAPPSAPILDLCVVVPAFNEAENLEPLAAQIDAALKGLAYEMIFVDDGSTDNSVQKLQDLKQHYPALRVLSHRVNAGQSRSLHSGIIAARAPIIATLDSDGQNDPADIPKLYKSLMRDAAADNLAMIGGQRQNRQDSWSKKWASRLANRIRKKLLQDGAHDTGCGLKLFYRTAFLSLPYFDHMHRYIPALMIRQGFEIEFMAVNHRARTFGRSKYSNFGRLKVAFADLCGVMWLNRRAKNNQGFEEL